MILALDSKGNLIAAKGRPQHQPRKRGEMNATESAFSQYLDLLLKCNRIDDRSKFEPYSLVMPLLRRKYTPDFEVVRLDGTKVLYDVKGCKLTPKKRIPRPWIEAKDRIRLEMFAREFLHYRFVVTWCYKDQWYEQEVLGA